MSGGKDTAANKEKGYCCEEREICKEAKKLVGAVAQNQWKDDFSAVVSSDSVRNFEYFLFSVSDAAADQSLCIIGKKGIYCV